LAAFWPEVRWGRPAASWQLPGSCQASSRQLPGNFRAASRQRGTRDAGKVVVVALLPYPPLPTPTLQYPALQTLGTSCGVSTEGAQSGTSGMHRCATGLRHPAAVSHARTHLWFADCLDLGGGTMTKRCPYAGKPMLLLLLLHLPAAGRNCENFAPKSVKSTICTLFRKKSAPAG
jgi:hypothetical protein